METRHNLQQNLLALLAQQVFHSKGKGYFCWNVSEFASFLMGETSNNTGEEEGEKEKKMLRKTLVERCNHISDRVS